MSGPERVREPGESFALPVLDLSRGVSALPRPPWPLWAWGGVALGALGAALVAARLAPTDLVFAGGVSVMVLLLAASIARPPLLIYAVLLSGPLAGLVHRYQPDRYELLGRMISFSGLRWLAVASLIALVLLVRVRPVVLPKAYLPFLAFGGWVALRTLGSGEVMRGFTDVFFLLFFPLVATYAVSVVRARPEPTATHLRVFFAASFVPVVLVFAVAFSIGIVRWTHDGPIGVLWERVVAAYLLLALGVSLAGVRYGADRVKRRWLMASAALTVATIVFTASRLAILVSVLLLAVSGMKPGRLRPLLLRALAGVAVTVLLFASIPQLRARLFEPYSPGASSANLRFDWTGRTRLWSTLLPEVLEHPLIGSGPGSARVVLGEVRGRSGVRGEDEFHVHNEYLAVLHGTGLIGLGLWLWALGTLLAAHYRAWARADASGASSPALWHLASLLGLSAVALDALVGNTLHYPTVTGPLFVVLGVAAAAPGEAESAEASKRELRTPA